MVKPIELSPGWKMEEELHADFMLRKYEDRKKLKADWKAKQKAADAQMVEGKPSARHEGMQAAADLASTRYDIAYVIAKQQELEARCEIMGSLWERVCLLEGAYSYIKGIAEMAIESYHLLTKKLVTKGAKDGETVTGSGDKGKIHAAE